jgi:hypothetical protein
VVLIAPLIAFLMWSLSHDRRGDLLRFITAISPFIVLIGAYNDMRFGSPLRMGYPGQPFNHNIVVGLLGLTVSPGRGLLIYAPVVVVAAGGMVLMWRASESRWVITIAGLLLIRMAFYSHWWAWYGGDGFGPRFLMPAVPALAVPLAVVFRQWRLLPRVARRSAIVLAALSLAIEVPGAFVNYNLGGLAADIYHATANGNPRLFVTAAGERRVDSVLFGFRHFPPIDELGLLRHRVNMSGHQFAPVFLRGEVYAIAAVCLLAVVGAIAAVRSTRAQVLDERMETL